MKVQWCRSTSSLYTAAYRCVVLRLWWPNSFAAMWIGSPLETRRGGEDAPEVVRGVVQWITVRAGEVRAFDSELKEPHAPAL